MKILETRPNGEPSVVEMTDTELIVRDIHSNLMDLGYSQGDAMIMLRGMAIPQTLQEPQPFLRRTLTPEFVAWLTS